MEKDEQFRILLLDDDMVVSSAVAKALKLGLPDAAVLTARNIAEAQVLVSEFAIHFFILDVNLPDGSGIDFLCDLRTTCPEAQVVVITGTPLPQHRDQLAGLEVLRYCEKPVDINKLVSLASQAQAQALGGNSPSSTSHETQFFNASLSKLSSMDIVQLKCLTGVTQVLEFTAGESSGSVYFDKGDIIHAETGPLCGEAALVKILSWRGGKVVEVAVTQDPPRTIWSNWQVLLLEVAQQMDENTSHRH